MRSASRLEPGQTIAIVGPTGAGKTTIINLIPRFYDVTGGVGDHRRLGRARGDDRKPAPPDRHRAAGYFPLQHHGHGEHSLRPAGGDATRRCWPPRAWHMPTVSSSACRRSTRRCWANAAAAFRQGQRQLIAIARAALADPRILILDEATSSVDTRTERLIQKAFDTLLRGRTSFVIAHRLSTVRNADVVLVLDHGDIVERGKFDELLARKGFFYSLYMCAVPARGGPAASPAGGDGHLRGEKLPA